MTTSSVDTKRRFAKAGSLCRHGVPHARGDRVVEGTRFPFGLRDDEEFFLLERWVLALLVMGILPLLVLLVMLFFDPQIFQIDITPSR